MKFVVATILTALLAYVAGLFLPWWSIAVAAFVAALIVAQRPLGAFLAGFLSILLLWGIMAYIIDSANNGILSKKVATILPLGGNGMLLILVTGFVGGLVAGLAALSGSFLRTRKIS